MIKNITHCRKEFEDLKMNNPSPSKSEGHKESKEPVPQTINATYRPYSYRRNGTAISNHTDSDMNKDRRSFQQIEVKSLPATSQHNIPTNVNNSGGPILKGPSFSRHHSCKYKIKPGSKYSPNPKSISTINNKISQTKYNNTFSRPNKQHKWTRSLRNDIALTSPKNNNESSDRPPNLDHNIKSDFSLTDSKRSSQLLSMKKVKNNALVLSKTTSLQTVKEEANKHQDNGNITDTTREYFTNPSKNSHDKSLLFYNKKKRFAEHGFRNTGQNIYDNDKVAKRIRLNNKIEEIISNEHSLTASKKNDGFDNDYEYRPRNNIKESNNETDKKDIIDGDKSKVLLTDFAYVSSTSSKTNRNSNLHPNGFQKFRNISNSTYKKNRGLIRVQPDISNTPICKTFAHGLICSNIYCTKRHDVPAEAAMPLCSYFQRNGQCLKNLDGKCPFRHVKVNPSAMECPSFSLLGFCENKNCVMKHNKTRSSRCSNNKYKNNQYDDVNKY